MLTTSTEFKLVLEHENPATLATDHWTITGKGDGQKEYYENKRKWPDATIRILTRDVVVSDWKFVKPDEPCGGSAYAHGPHGKCSGYTTDRT